MLSDLDDALTAVMDPEGEVEKGNEIVDLALKRHALMVWRHAAGQNRSMEAEPETAEELAIYDGWCSHIETELYDSCAGHPALDIIRDALRTEIRNEIKQGESE